MVYRRNRTWHADFRYRCPETGRRRRFRRTTGLRGRRVEAEALARRWHRELEAPPPPVEHAAAFSGFAHHWLALHVRGRCSPSTQRSYEQILRVHLVPFFGDRDLRSLTAEDGAAYRSARREMLSAKTVVNHLGVLSSMLEKAVAWGYCTHNIARGIERPRVPPPPVRWWTRAQSGRFLIACQEVAPDWHPFFLTALRTGLRLGELIALRARDVQLDGAGMIDVRRSVHRGLEGPPKSGRARQVPLTPSLKAVLSLRLEGLSVDGLVFPGPQGGFVTRDQIKHPFWRATAGAGLERIRFHDLRHSFASQLVSAGKPLPAVQQLLGHADLRTTMRYAHLVPDGMSGVVAVLDEEDGP